MANRFRLIWVIFSVLIVATLSPFLSSSAVANSATITQYEIEVLTTETHDDEAFTQGFLFHQGKLYESTGLYGESTLREVNLQGEVLRSVNLSSEEFGEGLTVHNNSLIQLTWKSGFAHIWDIETLSLVGNLSYQDEGWGICSDGINLVMSNGTSDLTVRNPEDFSVIQTVSVTFNGSPLTELNELECVGDLVYANVWHWESIFIINMTSGNVVGTIDASSLFPEPPDGGVLNGVAYDSENDTFWLTGKNWPIMHQVIFKPLVENNSENISEGGGANDGLDGKTTEFKLPSTVEEFLLIFISAFFALLTNILWGNGFFSLTKSRGVDNPPAATMYHGEQE
ncbi:MAG: glutaminyl-peptide cyclotransferase [Candidatus Poseidoniales archaeon]|nr:glutaminyl-peptide cyclotransferase [Candidatus Poseidoniales archaeon]